MKRSQKKNNTYDPNKKDGSCMYPLMKRKISPVGLIGQMMNRFVKKNKKSNCGG